MISLKNLFCVILVVLITILSCSKKSSSNSRNGEEDSQITTTTTSGNGGTSTTGGTTGTTSSAQATGTIAGAPSCTLNPMQVISSNFLSSMTLNTAGSQQTSVYSLYNFNSSYFVRLYFASTMAPATGGYTVMPTYPPFSGSQVTVEFEPNGTGAGSFIGNAQSGVVYVTNTGTLVSAVFCNLPVKFQSGGNTYMSNISARIEK